MMEESVFSKSKETDDQNKAEKDSFDRKVSNISVELVTQPPPTIENIEIANPSNEDKKPVLHPLSQNEELVDQKDTATQITNVNLRSTDISMSHNLAESNIQNVKLPIRIGDPLITTKIDCKEKIVFCIDMSTDMNDPPFKLGNGGEFSPLSMVKRVVEIFIHSKQKINNKHEFGVMGFDDVAVWYKGFTSDEKEIIDSLDEINEVKVCQGSGLTSVFTILSVIASEFPSFSKLDVIPQFVFRVILIYGRSHYIPEKMEHIDMFKFLKSSPYFFFDVLYVHEVPSAENKCEEIFEHLCDMDEDETSYIFEVARNTTKLHNCMAKLIAHPLQRPLQKYAQYKLSDVSIEC